MCGITGFTSSNNSLLQSSAIDVMTKKIAHRGPDASGVWRDNSIAIGHRRLSIIDLNPRSAQPMKSSDERYVLSYNGEIYNYLELKAELIELGHRFKTQSDTEVVLQAYCQWGTGCVHRLEGMFAFAIWDRVEKVLTLVRDHCGIKPLYYSHQGATFLFASEIRSILSHPEVSIGIDRKSLAEYFTFQNFFDSRTLYKNINLLEPGYYLQFHTKKNCLTKERYWDFNFEEPAQERSEADYLEELNDLFTTSVRRHLISDVPIGSYLSGGIDSGSIASIASQFNKSLKTFCVGFNTEDASFLELGFDESSQALELANLIGTEHYTDQLSAGHLEPAIKTVTNYLEEPRVGQSYPNYYAAQLAGKHVKVVLTGTGGDEIFGGYPWRYYRGAQAKNFNEFTDLYYNFWQRLVPSEVQSSFFSPMHKQLLDFNPKKLFKNVFRNYHQDISSPIDMINASLYFEAKTFLNGLLIIEDKLNMSAGIESRVPFLDKSLVKFAMKLPMKHKLRKLGNITRVNENEFLKSKKHFSKTNDGKLILRKVMQGYLPDKILKRQKQGFSAPDQTWFKNHRTKYIQKRFFDRNSPVYEFLDKRTIQMLIEDHTSGKNNRRLLIWSLLTFDEWLKQNLGAA